MFFFMVDKVMINFSKFFLLEKNCLKNVLNIVIMEIVGEFNMNYDNNSDI